MIIWINGPFGIGKTTTARVLHSAIDGALLADPEHIGFVLRPILGATHPVDDFQDWPAWRRMVSAELSALSESADGPVIVPQTVVVEHYWREIMNDLADRGALVRAFTLSASDPEHERRIAGDSVERAAAGWRRARAADFRAALPWLAERTVILDTDGIAPVDVARQVARRSGYPFAS